MKANQNHIVEPNKKVSSVEWLFEQINDALIDFTEGKISASIYGIRVTEYKQQAKQMHKDEIVKSMSVAFIDGAKIGGITYESPYEDWEQYYNETFGTSIADKH
jgi:hypothetical protein